MEIWLILGVSVAALLFALFLVNKVLRQDVEMPGTQRISTAIKEGSEAFLARQNKIIGTLQLPLSALTFVIYS